jgi:hypothetical protein
MKLARRAEPPNAGGIKCGRDAIAAATFNAPTVPENRHRIACSVQQPLHDVSLTMRPYGY